MGNDFELVETKRTRKNKNEIERVEGEIVEWPDAHKNNSGKEQLIGAVADNFDRIVDIAASIVEIEKMNAMADAHIRELEEKRKMLGEEADAYVKKLNAKTNATVSKVEAIRMMMQDYYVHGKDGLSSEEFSKILQEIISKIGVSDE